MNRNHKTPLRKEDCPPPEDVIASLLDNVNDADDEALQRHVENCPKCRKLLEDTHASVTMLRNTEAGPIGRDLTSEILSKIPQKAWHDHIRESSGRSPAYLFAMQRPFMRIAAIVLILLGIGALALHLTHSTPKGSAGQSPKVSAVDKGVEWLLARQTSSGGWNAEAWGGKPEYDTALNGLAILALSRANGETVTLRTSLQRAATCLIGQQAENGRLGQDFDGTLYNHGVATLALLEVYRLTQDEQWRSPITKALTFILACQSPAGGWGYLNNRSSTPNTSVTAWQVQSLLLADTLGWQENRVAVRKALTWMTGTVNENGYFGYEGPRPLSETSNTLTMMGAYCVLSAQHLDIPDNPNFTARVIRGIEALAGERPDDYYGAFFFSSALAEIASGTFKNAMTAAQNTLVARQQTTGGNSGAWLATDRWGSTGGLLYSTSMAMLALTPPAMHQTSPGTPAF